MEGVKDFGAKANKYSQINEHINILFSNRG